MRLIDADAMIEWYKASFPFDPSEVRFSINDIEMNMLNIPNEESGWIPRKERMPEESGRYLVTFQERTIDICWFENKHFRIFGEIKDKFVSAWQPLPEPYKSENS